MIEFEDSLEKNDDYVGLPKEYYAEGIMVDENKEPLIRIAFKTHRDIITEIGYEAVDIIPEDIRAALGETCRMVHGIPVMTAWTIKAEDIANAVSENAELNKADIQCGQIAEMVLKESLKSYSDFYVNRKKELLEKENNLDKS